MGYVELLKFFYHKYILLVTRIFLILQNLCIIKILVLCLFRLIYIIQIFCRFTNCILNLFIFFVDFSQIFKEIDCFHYSMRAIKNIFWEFKLFQFSYYFSECAVEIIFDLVIGPPWNILWDFSPFIAMNFMGLNEYLLFILVPFSLLDHLI